MEAILWDKQEMVSKHKTPRYNFYISIKHWSMSKDFFGLKFLQSTTFQSAVA